MIDDVGDRLDLGRRAVALPAPVTLAFLPHTTFAARLAHAAHAAGKEVMLHLPMESVIPRPLGPGGITLHMDEAQFSRTLEADLAAIPHVRGVNNHMGSLLTPHPGHMSWLMARLRARGDLYFIDSRTTASSVAPAVAREHGVPHLVRDVFLDPDPTPARIEAQWRQAVALARTHGRAVVIGHPYPDTLALLERELPRLAAQGCRVVAPSALITQHQQRSPELWHASLSPSPPAAKNSKP